MSHCICNGFRDLLSFREKHGYFSMSLYYTQGIFCSVFWVKKVRGIRRELQ